MNVPNPLCSSFKGKRECCLLSSVTTDAAILRVLKLAGESGVSGAALAKDLHVSRAAVWNRIEELRRHGFQIEASPQQGYILRGTPGHLHQDDLHSRLLPDRVIGREIRVYQCTNSTNDLIDKLARDGVAEGMVVFAEQQSQGRGRMGRRWESPPGTGLWFSVLLRPNLQPQSVTQLTVLSAVAVARAIERETGLQPEIKWPNDIVFGLKKAAGILLELRAELDRVRHVVLGIGVNLNQRTEDWPPPLRDIAVSLAELVEKPIDRPALAARLLIELDAAYRQVRGGNFQGIRDEWLRRCSTLGRDLTIRIGNRVLQGRAESLDDEGALLVRQEHGHLERVIGGDVTLEKSLYQR